MGVMTVKELQTVFSQNIKKRRAQLGLSQMKFAEKADLSVSYVCDLESGRRWGTPETFIKLADALEIEPFELLIASYESVGTENIHQSEPSTKWESQLRKNLSEAIDTAISRTLMQCAKEKSEA